MSRRASVAAWTSDGLRVRAMRARACERTSRRRDWAFQSSVFVLRPNFILTSFSALMRSPCHGWLGVSYLRRLNLGWPIYFLPPEGAAGLAAPAAGFAGAAAALAAAPAAADGALAAAGAPAAGEAASGAAWPASLRWPPTAPPKRPWFLLRWPRVGSRG